MEILIALSENINALVDFGISTDKTQIINNTPYHSTVYLTPQVITNQGLFDRSILHECYHQYQREHGYKRLIPKLQEKYACGFSDMISSLILDQNVYKWMDSENFNYVKDSYEDIYSLWLEMIDSVLDDPEKFILFPSICGLLYMNYSRELIINELLVHIKNKDSIIYNQILMLLHILDDCHLDSSNSCNEALLKIQSVFPFLILSDSLV